MATEGEQDGIHERCGLREHFLNNVGQILDAAEIQAVSGGIVDLPRLICELCDDEGYRIQTHADRGDLMPGQFVLESALPEPWFAPAVSADMQVYVRARPGFTCQMCGAAPGELDEHDATRRLRFYIGHATAIADGGADEPWNLRVLCSLCHDGVADTPLDRSCNEHILGHLQRATGSAQLEALAWLVRKHPGRARFYLGDGE